MKNRVKEFLSGLMVLTTNEQDFLRKFREREYCPELLFDDGQVIKRISNHPMALWKMQEH